MHIVSQLNNQSIAGDRLTVVRNVAHIRDSTKVVQSLEEHLVGTAELAERFIREIGIADVGTVIGLLHDLGKASQDFNDYITGKGDCSRGEIDHSTAGAQFLKEYAKKDDIYRNMAIEMMELAIASHHSGLIDCISIEGEPVFTNRINKDVAKTNYNEALGRIDSSIIAMVNSSMDGAIDSLASTIVRICKSTKDLNSRMFRLGLLNRFLLSCLIDADRIDTISFQTDRTYAANDIVWDEIKERFEERISRMDNKDGISAIRKQVSDDCLVASASIPGVFTLSVPTGGGKTLSSFRFAVNHLCRNGMCRIIYVVPYLSIIEQNAAVIRRMVNSDCGCDLVTECHSNVDIGDDDLGGVAEWKSLMDSWDGPIIFTSMVQFLEVLFSSGTKRVRRLHNLVNSVIIFDEIQCLPIKTVYMFNEAVNFICKECGSSVVLCTATQPCLGSGIEYPIEMSNSIEMIADVSSLFNKLRRTSVSYVNPDGPPADCEFLADLSLNEIENVTSVLIIVNTKKLARNLYDLLKKSASSDIGLFHLSTNMCAVHRKKKLDDLKTRLGRKRIICVSTQLIEAGVDIDFDSVIRSMAGLDSIAQAAGRCNRNARRECGHVMVVRTDENLSSLRDIEEGRRYADILMKMHPGDVINPDIMREYYSYYFFKRRNEMYYSTAKSGQNLFGMLSNNNAGVQSYRSRFKQHPSCLMRQAFRDANCEFNVIDPVQSIIVPYDEKAKNAISQLCSYGFDDRKNAMRVLQNYSINTFNLDQMMKKGMIAKIDYGSSSIFCLKEGFYSEDVGLTENAEHRLLML